MKSRLLLFILLFFTAGTLLAQDPIRPFRIAADSHQPGEGIDRVVDGKPNTIWHTEHTPNRPKHPHWILCDFGEPREIEGFHYLPRPDGSNGTVKEFAVYLGDDLNRLLDASVNNENGEKPWFESEFRPDDGSDTFKTQRNITFPLKRARYMKFEIRSNQQNNEYASGAEFTPLVRDARLFALGNWNPRSDEPFPDVAKYEGKIRVVSVSSESPDGELWRALDDDPETVWRTYWNHHHDAHRDMEHLFVLDLGEPTFLTGFVLTPARGGGNGSPKRWTFYTGDEKDRVNEELCKGEFEPTAEPKTVRFDHPVFTRFLKFRIHETQHKQPWASIAEFKLLGLDPQMKFPFEPYDEEKNEKLRQIAKNGHWEACDDWRCLLDLTLRTLEFIRQTNPRPGNFHDFERRVWELEARIGNDGDKNRYRDELRSLRREIILSHPQLNFDKILITKRPPTRYSHMCDQYLGRHSGIGPGLTVLENWKDRGGVRVREILRDKMPPGTVQNPCLHWDGSRVVFSFCDHTEPKEDLRCFYIWEAAVDGSWVRQITGTQRDPLATWENRKTVMIEDFDPCYLPDGGIAFTSTRNQTYGRCHGGRYTPAYMLFRCEADGSKIRQISFGEANEWAPSVLANGRLIYTRWDYINRHDTYLQGLWQMQPDGTSTAHYYGNSSRTPCMSTAGTQVPDSRLVATIAMAHHSYSVGSLHLLDTTEGEDGFEPIIRITPEISFPESHDPVGGGGSGGYATPFPLSESLYFAARNEIRRRNRDGHAAGQGGIDPVNAYAIYLVDSIGGRELIYYDDQMSSFSPMPLIRRETPPTLVSRIDDSEDISKMKNPTGIFYIQDIFQSRQPLVRGEGKAIRVNQIFGQPRPGRPGSSIVDNEIVKGTLGTVPVGADGKVAFEAPAGVPLQLQLIDENEMAILTMRTVVYLQPGEVSGCVGCHEQRESTLSAYSTPASMGMGEIRKITPSVSQNYPGGFSFQKSVQPALDRHCISCHGLDGRNDGNLNLMNEWTDHSLSRAYRALANTGRIAFAHRNSETDISVPKDYFAHAGTLVSYLKGDHAKHWNPEPEAMKRIVNWLDLNAQCYGDYSDNRIERRGLRENRVDKLREAIREEFPGQDGERLSRQPTDALINVANWQESRILMAPLSQSAGGWGQIGKWNSADDPVRQRFVALVRDSLNPINGFDVFGLTSWDYDHDWIRQERDKPRGEQREYDWPKMPDRQPENLKVRLHTLDARDAEIPWKIHRVSSEETVKYDFSAKNAVDGEDDTFWVSAFDWGRSHSGPHELVVDLGESMNLGGLMYRAFNRFGNLKDCEIFVSENPDSPGEPILRGYFDRDHDTQNAMFPEIRKGRFVTLRIHSSLKNSEFAAIRELRFMVQKEEEEK